MAAVIQGSRAYPAHRATPVKPQRQKASHPKALFAGALAIAIASAAVGAVAAEAEQVVRPAHAGSVERVAAAVVPSVVQLQSHNSSQQEQGSGIILSPDGLILTNNHVISPLTEPAGGAAGAVATFDDGRTAPFSLVATDPDSDVAVVRVQGVSGLTPIAFGSSADLRVGQQVVAIGSPLGLNATVTTGIVSALRRPLSSPGNGHQHVVFEAIQTDAPINPGNSGGALVNMNGKLIGVNSAIVMLGAAMSPAPQSGSIGLGFAIPVEQAKRVADQLIATGKASHATLGVQVGADPASQGAMVADVTSGGPAGVAGLPAGAVVTKLDDHVIGTGDALLAAVLAKAPGDPVILTYTDPSGHTHTAHATLGSDRDQS
jgi:putative serine protease PepD